MPSEVHLWQVHQADFDLLALEANCLSWLTEVEVLRYCRYQFDRHRKQFLLGRAVIRVALSSYEQSIKPGEWRFTQNEYGKPAIHPDQQIGSLFFNLSHSGESLVLVLAGFANIGVDIQRSLKTRRIAAIAQRYFSGKEVEELKGLSAEQQQTRFYELWTLKEAYIKACGMGLAISLRHFSCFFPGTDKLAIKFDSLRNDDEKAWQLWQLDAGDAYKLAIAARAGVDSGPHKILSWKMACLDKAEARETIIHRRS